MAIDLFRVDERLIHGQVAIGWGSQLRPERYIVVDDALAHSDWEQELYRLGAGGAEVLFTDVDSARAHLEEWEADPRRTILLTRDIDTMTRLGEEGRLSGREVNLGGIHYEPGRKEVLPYLFLTEHDREELRHLAEEGAEISARDLPDAHRVSLKQLLAR
ncbi:MAG: PTS system mannose/fructose/N-acetylgalactosamine-transporter subunit IIB [Gemmatimonadota bacterium]